MNTDFRISVNFFTNQKIRRLQRQRSEEGVLSLIRLWSYTAIHRPSGELHGMDIEDVLDATEWRGDVDFVETLLELKLIDFDGEIYKIHNWGKHNNWAIGAVKRSETARKAAQKRWGNSSEK